MSMRFQVTALASPSAFWETNTRPGVVDAHTVEVSLGARATAST
jgi:hypothetical protein